MHGPLIRKSKEVKITIKNLQKRIPIHPSRIKRAILNVLSSEGAGLKGEITVCFVDDSCMRGLNLRFKDKDCPTDVLSFDLSEKKINKGLLADIIISAEAAFKNSRRYMTAVSHELELYSIHGLLHLLGYDDSDLKQRRLMRKKECLYARAIR